MQPSGELGHAVPRTALRPPKRPCQVRGAQERTRTSTPLRAPAPEAGASTNSATWARRARCQLVGGAIWRPARVLSIPVRGLVRLIIENIARLAVELFANRLQGRNAYALHLAGLEPRQIGLRDVDLGCEILRAHLPKREHHVETDDDA